MVRTIRAVIAACVVAFATASSANAAPVAFLGTVTAPASLFAVGTTVGLELDFTPAAGLVAVVNSATLNIGGQTWNVLAGASTITVLDNGVGNDNLAVSLQLGPSTPGNLGTVAAILNLTINGVADLGPGVTASAANVALIAANGHAATGSLVVVGPGVSNVTFSGTSVPEPGSMLLLSGLGCVVAGRAWRRRRQAKTEA